MVGGREDEGIGVDGVMVMVGCVGVCGGVSMGLR